VKPVRQLREVPVLAKVEVVVVGGGVSGCAAAAAAARAGAETLLIEKNAVLGGVATAGLMGNIGNLYMTQSEQHVTRGIALECVNQLVEKGGASPGWSSRDVAGCVMDPEKFKLVLIELLEDAGVEILLHGLVTGIVGDKANLKGVILETRTGPRAIEAEVVIDASGETDVAAMTAAPLQWSKGSASLEFRMSNVNIHRLYRFFKDHPEQFPQRTDMVMNFDQFEKAWQQHGVFFFPHGGGKQFDLIQDLIEKGDYKRERGIAYDLDAFGMYGIKGLNTVVINSNFYRVDDLDIKTVSQMEIHARKMCHYAAEFLQNHVPGFEQAYLVDTADEIGIRISRGIKGECTLTSEHVSSSSPVRFDDVIGVTPCRRRSVQDSFFWNASCDIPYRCMLPLEVENLLVASGKGVSTSPMGIIRGMSCCMVLGQGAGVAAATAVNNRTTVRNVNIKQVQQRLIAQDVYLGENARLRQLGLACR